MSVTSSSRWLHRFAWLTATLTLLLPVTTGAIVTTLDAGMIFSDWPSSDGHNMLAYPWLTSARDQFVEHGHRLAGLTVGLLSIALAISAWVARASRTARLLALAIFASVFAQGILGGFRVLMDAKVMALIHGDFAAGVFSLMCVFVLVTGSRWEARTVVSDQSAGLMTRNLSIVILTAIVVQYFLGGVVRHLIPFGLAGALSAAWVIHPWFALVPVLLSPILVVVAQRTGSQLLIRYANLMVFMVIGQALVGLATWYFRYGFPMWGVVAQQGSLSQIISSSAHKVVGMLTLMTSVLNVVCALAVQPPVSEVNSSRSESFEGSMMGAAT
jgi:cytochrome c oxidase assembly protein subunit 15